MLSSDYKGYLGCAVRQLSDDEATTFLICVTHDSMGDKVDENIVKTFPFQVLNKRLIFTNAKVSDWTKAYVTSLCQSPADAVLWAFTLAHIYAKRNEEVTMVMWADEFPMGVPTDAEYHRLWDMQKGKPGEKIDNWLDDFGVWPKN